MRRHWQQLIATVHHIRGDWTVNHRDVFRPSFQALANYRFGVWNQSLPLAIRLATAPLYWIPLWFIRGVYGISLPRTTVVGKKLKLGHNIVIHPYSRIGDYCTIRQNVTIGAKSLSTYRQAPTLGNSVSIGAGAVLLGGIQVGDSATIGPNCVVMTNVPAQAVVYIPPPRMMIRTAAKPVVEGPTVTEGK